jgi:hypothetical protein
MKPESLECFLGHTIAYTVTDWLLNMRSCGICGGKSGTEAGLLQDILPTMPYRYDTDTTVK